MIYKYYLMVFLLEGRESTELITDNDFVSEK